MRLRVQISSGENIITNSYYVPDPKNKDWHMVIQVKPRDVYDMGDEDYDATIETTQLVAPNNLEYLIPEGDEPVPTVREREDGDE